VGGPEAEGANTKSAMKKLPNTLMKITVGKGVQLRLSRWPVDWSRHLPPVRGAPPGLF
jgi:hypothetical protein